MADQINTLRLFRDEYLLTDKLGQMFVSLYYQSSPPVAGFIEDHPVLKPAVRIALLPAISMSRIVVSAGLIAKVGIFVVVAAVFLWLTLLMRRKAAGPEV